MAMDDEYLETVHTTLSLSELVLPPVGHKVKVGKDSLFSI